MEWEVGGREHGSWEFCGGNYSIRKPEDVNCVKEGPCCPPWEQKHSLYHWVQLVLPISFWPFHSASCSYAKLWSPPWDLSYKHCIQLTCLSVGLTYKANTEPDYVLCHWLLLRSKSLSFLVWITIGPPHCSFLICHSPSVSASMKQPEWSF